MNTQLAAVAAMSLKRLANDELAAANLALSFQGEIPKENISFEAMRKYRLIRENGKPEDSESLLAALSLVINERVDSGEWAK